MTTRACAFSSTHIRVHAAKMRDIIYPYPSSLPCTTTKPRQQTSSDKTCVCADQSWPPERNEWYFVRSIYIPLSVLAAQARPEPPGWVDVECSNASFWLRQLSCIRFRPLHPLLSLLFICCMTEMTRNETKNINNNAHIHIYRWKSYRCTRTGAA